MSDNATSGLIFTRPFPERITGSGALVIPVCGWLAGDISRVERVVVGIDGGFESELRLGEPLPARLWPGVGPGVGDGDRRGFAGEVHLPPAGEGFRHSVVFCIEACSRDQSLTIVSSVERTRPRVAEPAMRNQSPRVAICMAVYNPDRMALERQVRSIRQQSMGDWICIVNDDGSDDEHQSLVREVVGEDDRFWYFRNERNLGFYSNFEMSLARVPEGIEYVALCDQDDDWYPEKLASLLDGLADGALLCYSDMRIVAENGDVLAPSYWGYRKNSWRDLSLMLVANTVTGAACMFRRELLERILPFPPRVGDAFHDHWLACSALAAGRIEYIDRPLYDYYQYGESIIGHCGFDRTPSREGRFSGNPVRLLKPANFRSLLARLIGSGQAVYWHECRRIESICANILSRGVDDVERKAILSAYGRGLRSMWSLFMLNLKHGDSARLTDNAERRLARGYLIHSVLKLSNRSR